MEKMAELHAMDKSAVNKVLAPIKAFKDPVTYGIAFGNGQAMICMADMLHKIGI